MTVRTDNLFIAHYQGSLLEEFHYYPFGMCFEVSKSPMLVKSAAVKYNSQLQDHEEFEDANGNVYGLEDYNFAFRNYDAQIGRWLQPDPLMQHPSPYLAMSNNPVSFTDPTGLWDGTIINSQGKIINQSGSHTDGYYVLDYGFGFGGSYVGDDAIKRSILFVYEITAYEFHTRNNNNRFLINQFRNRFMVSMDAGGNPRPLGEAYGKQTAGYNVNHFNWALGLIAQRGRGWDVNSASFQNTTLIANAINTNAQIAESSASLAKMDVAKGMKSTFSSMKSQIITLNKISTVAKYGGAATSIASSILSLYKISSTGTITMSDALGFTATSVAIAGLIVTAPVSAGVLSASAISLGAIQLLGGGFFDGIKYEFHKK